MPPWYGQRGQAGLLERVGGFFDLFARAAIDDAGFAFVLAEEIEQLAARVGFFANAVADVGAVEAGDEHARGAEIEPGEDFGARRGVGGGGERDARHVGKAFVQGRQAEIFRAEIVPPLRHAVRFVDGEQRDARLFEQALKTRGEQAFRRDIQQLELAGDEFALDLHRRRAIQTRIQKLGGDAQFFQGGDLILHQRDQRRHHHRAALAQQRRNLETQRFATAGGHQHQRVAARHERIDDGRLLAAKRGVAEDAVEQA